MSMFQRQSWTSELCAKVHCHRFDGRCEAVVLVVPRGVAPRKHYGFAAIAIGADAVAAHLPAGHSDSAFANLSDELVVRTPIDCAATNQQGLNR